MGKQGQRKAGRRGRPTKARGIMSWFGKKKEAAPAPPPVVQPPNQQNAIAKIRDTLETVGKREAHLDRKIQTEIQNAKAANSKGDKAKALACIKRKKLYDQQMDTLRAQVRTLETQLMSLEQMHINKEILDANRAAANDMKRGVQEMGGIDQIENTMDAVEDGLQDAQEVNAALGRTVGDSFEHDDDDLLAELEALEMEDLTSQVTEVKGPTMPDAPVSFPSAGTTDVSATQTEEDKELAELEKSMAM